MWKNCSEKKRWQRTTSYSIRSLLCCRPGRQQGRSSIESECMDRGGSAWTGSGSGNARTWLEKGNMPSWTGRYGPKGRFHLLSSYFWWINPRRGEGDTANPPDIMWFFQKVLKLFQMVQFIQKGKENVSPIIDPLPYLAHSCQDWWVAQRPTFLYTFFAKLGCFKAILKDHTNPPTGGGDRLGINPPEVGR